jgi:hypothetical protein
MRTTMTAALPILVYFDAFAWLVGTVPTLYYAFTHRSLPTLTGIRLMSGPFEKLGLDGLIVAGLVFVVVSALKILAGYWLWNSRLDGRVLDAILLGSA